MSKLEIKENHYPNGQLESKAFYLDGIINNEYGPAYQQWYPNGQLRFQAFYLDGIIHNEYGPASQYWFNDGQLSTQSFWINNIQIEVSSTEEFKNYIKHLII